MILVIKRQPNKAPTKGVALKISETVRWDLAEFFAPIYAACMRDESAQRDDLAVSQIRTMEKTVREILPDIADLPIHELDYITPLPRPVTRGRPRAPP